MHFILTLTLASLVFTATLAAPSNGDPQIDRRAEKVQQVPPKNPQIHDWREEPWSHYVMTDSLNKLYPVDMKEGTCAAASRLLLVFEMRELSDVVPQRTCCSGILQIKYSDFDSSYWPRRHHHTVPSVRRQNPNAIPAHRRPQDKRPLLGSNRSVYCRRSQNTGTKRPRSQAKMDRRARF